VRPEARVTGFHSGLKAAGKEFSYGVYDGITGLVTQPIKGAKQGGAAGALKGLGRGIGGLILKNGAAVWAIPAYAMKGIHREIVKLGTKDVAGYISSARAAQGVHEVMQSPLGTKQLVIDRWNSRDTPSAGWTGRMSSWSSCGGGQGGNDKKTLVDMSNYDDDMREVGSDTQLQLAMRESAADQLHHSPTWSSGSVMDDKIKGNAAGLYYDGTEEDEELRLALCRSISEQDPPPYQPPAYEARWPGDQKRPAGDEIGELQGANWASSPGSSTYALAHPRSWSSSADVKRKAVLMTDNTRDDGDDDDDEQLRLAVQASLGYAPGNPVYVDSVAAQDSELFRENAELQNALRMSLAESERSSRTASASFSKSPYAPPVPLSAACSAAPSAVEDRDDDGELARAVQESLRLEADRRAKHEEEERVVMEYVARESLAMEELKRARQTEHGSSSGSQA